MDPAHRSIAATVSKATGTDSAAHPGLAEEAAHRPHAFVIAHLLSTIRDADPVLVMDQVRLVERGTDDAIIAQGSIYAASSATPPPPTRRLTCSGVYAGQ